MFLRFAAPFDDLIALHGKHRSKVRPVARRLREVVQSELGARGIGVSVRNCHQPPLLAHASPALTASMVPWVAMVQQHKAG